MENLPVETLQHIGSFLPFTERCTTFPLISKAFAGASCCTALGDLWASVALEASPNTAHSGKQAQQRHLQRGCLSWLAPRANQVENLRVDCQALRPQPGSFSQLLGLFAASANLRSLHVTGCEEVAIAAALPMLPSFANLEVLRFEEVDGFCDHGFTLQALSSMTNLRSLRVSLREGFLHTWPDLARMQKLETLDMRGCPAYGHPWAAWAPLPGWMTKLTSLRSLSSGCAGFTEVPPVVAALTQLTRLAIEDSCLGCAPFPAGQLPAKKQLPPGFHLLTNLKSLSLGTWACGVVPDEICALTNLEELSWRGELPADLDGCEDDYADDYEGTPDQSARVFALPKEFGSLRKLRVLKLDCHPGMTELPPQILKLTSLESLDLSNTPLSSLPDNLHTLPNLASLHLASCSFTCVPPPVFSVPSLRHLDLGRNSSLDLGELSRAQLAWLAKLGSLSLAKLGDCVWRRESLPALTFLESAAALLRRSYLQQAQTAESSTCTKGQCRDTLSEGGNICVLERLQRLEGCPSVGVLEPDGHLVRTILAV